MSERQFTESGNSPPACSRKKRTKPVPRTAFKCEHCGKPTTALTPQYTKFEHHFCSRVCHAGFERNSHSIVFACDQCKISCRQLKSDYKQRKNHFCSPACAHAFRRTGHITSQGYRFIRVNGTPVLEHRHVMEQVIGRALERWEQVHHGPQGKAVNTSDNLSLALSGQHTGHTETELADWLRSVGWSVVPPVRLHCQLQESL
jgi:hypothetical protein